MTTQLPKMRDRHVMQHLKPGEWKPIWQSAAAAGERLLDRMVRFGWTERRASDRRGQIWIAPKGLEALKMPLPDSAYQKRSR